MAASDLTVDDSTTDAVDDSTSMDEWRKRGSREDEEADGGGQARKKPRSRSSDMARGLLQLALRTCFSCRRRFERALRAPKILSCGHVLCLECAGLSAQTRAQIAPDAVGSVRCPRCGAVTQAGGGPATLDDDEVLLRSIDASSDCAVDEEETRKEHNSSETVCDRCSGSAAVVACGECEAKMCDACFDQVHCIGKLREHAKLPIDSKKARPTAVQCPDHPSEQAALICLDDGCSARGARICWKCVYPAFAGAHPGHSNKPLQEAGQAVHERLHAVAALLAQAVPSAVLQLQRLAAGRAQLQQRRQQCHAALAERFAELRSAAQQQHALLVDRLGADCSRTDGRLADGARQLHDYLRRAYAISASFERLHVAPVRPTALLLAVEARLAALLASVSVADLTADIARPTFELAHLPLSLCLSSAAASSQRASPVKPARPGELAFQCRPLGALGSHGCGDGQFRQPSDVCFDSCNNIFVVDSGNDRIQVFTADCDFLFSFGAHGSAAGEFDRPVAACFDAGNQLFVLDQGNMRVQVFDVNGTYLRSWPVSVSRNAVKKHSRPVSLLALDGMLLLADAAREIVQIYTAATGVYNRWVCPSGPQRGRVTEPRTLRAGARHPLVVVDRLKVQQFDYNAATDRFHLRSDITDIASPVDVAFDAAGNVFVAHQQPETWLSVFNRKGQLIASFHDNPEKFTPRAIVFDSSQRLFVCTDNDSILIYT